MGIAVLFAHEMEFLGAAIKTHKERIAKAATEMDTLQGAFEEAFGFHPCESPEHAPGWTAARAQYETLCEERGYFWACSRYSDLEHLVGKGWTSQLPLFSGPTAARSSGRSWVLGGETPKAHKSVAGWVVGVFGLAPEFEAAIEKMAA